MATATDPYPSFKKHELLRFSLRLQEHYEAMKSLHDRKRRGQFFTPAGVANFMVGLCSPFAKRFGVLDPGAGTGTLSAAVCERILRLRSPRDVHFQLFENDPALVSLLEENMQHCRSALRQAGHTVGYTIHPEDFILSNSHVFGQGTLFARSTQANGFDLAIMNPPYFKIAGDSAYARIMDRIVHGQPNIYALFMALGAQMLKPGGELIAITPRSFCNGLYFRGFRRWFFKRMSLRHIHLFESRTDTFPSGKVLQENVITMTQKVQTPSTNVVLTTSYGCDIANMPPSRTMPTRRILDNTTPDMMVRIPQDAEDARILDLVEAWPNRFADLGLRVSTGPVVMFRAKRFLLGSVDGEYAAPLLSVHNVRPFEAAWPINKKNKPTAFRICPESLSRRLLLPTRNYVLLRRFSAKEERRRLTACCFLKNRQVSQYVALENHLNYVYHADRELTDEEVYGLTALFNSALMDRYFRMISGNTQVNATELRTMNLPDLRTISQIGKRVRQLSDFTSAKVEQIVLAELGVTGPLERHLTELAL